MRDQNRNDVLIGALSLWWSAPIIALIVAGLLAMGGCATLKGAVVGGSAGAVIGGIAGGGRGALKGGAVGGLLGAAVGSSFEEYGYSGAKLGGHADIEAAIADAESALRARQSVIRARFGTDSTVAVLLDGNVQRELRRSYSVVGEETMVAHVENALRNAGFSTVWPQGGRQPRSFSSGGGLWARRGSPFPRGTKYVAVATYVPLDRSERESFFSLIGERERLTVAADVRIFDAASGREVGYAASGFAWEEWPRKSGWLNRTATNRINRGFLSGKFAALMAVGDLVEDVTTTP